MWETFQLYWDEITAWAALINLVITLVGLGSVLTVKKEPMSALAWCLVILLVPFVGMLLFVLLGYQQVQRPLSRKARHKLSYRDRMTAGEAPGESDVDTSAAGPCASLARLAVTFDAAPASAGNQVRFYYDGAPAFAAKLDAIRAARHHIHLEYFIFQPDEIGGVFLEALAEKARQGVEVRLLYDAMGSRRLHRWRLHALRRAGGQFRSFLPLDPLRRRIQVNLRNHRKIMVVDGEVAFTGGLNIGDEYLGRVARFGYWRDTHLRLEGPAVRSLQRLFVEDWDFASGEQLRGAKYFPPLRMADGGRRIDNPASPATDQGDGAPLLQSAIPNPQSAIDCTVQVIHSGPDQLRKSIREIYFAAILRARRRLWIATPYFVPDAGLFDAIRLAGYEGVDVRLLCQFHPDKWIPYYAARFYWDDVLASGVKVYQYTRGMMHSKVMLVDSAWASVGSANFDNRSMHLNFEVNCLLYTPAAVADLEQAFLRDLETSIQLNREVFARRPFASRLMENASRLLSPVL